MVNALRAYKDGTRDDDTMTPRAKKLDDVAMTTLSAYYAGLDPKPVNIPRPLSPDEWAEKCDRCHGLNGNSTRPDVPALAAQRLDYLEAALSAYRSGARKSSEMTAMSSILTPGRHQGTRRALRPPERPSRGLHHGPEQVKELRTSAERAKLASRSRYAIDGSDP